MAEVIGHGLGDFLVGGGKADAPAGHGKRLGRAVDGDGALLDLLTQGGKAGKLTHIDQLVIDLIADDIQIVLQHDLGDSLQLLLGIKHTGGIGGIGQDQRLGLGRNDLLQHLGRDLKAGLLRGVDHNGHAAGHLDRFLVGHPVGRRQDHLIPRIADSLQRNKHIVLGTAAHADLAGLIVNAILTLHPLADRITQGHDASRRGVPGLVVADGLDGRDLDAVGGGEIRLTGAKADDINAVRLHLLGKGVHCHRSGRGDALCDAGNRLHGGNLR